MNNQRQIGCVHYYNDAHKCVWCGEPKRDQFTVEEADRFIKLVNDTSLATVIGALACLCESNRAQCRNNGDHELADHWGQMSIELTQVESSAQRKKI